MTIIHHPRDETLMDYASGTLTSSLAAVVACHLSLCETCRAKLVFMERIGGALLTRLAGEALTQDALAQTLSPLNGAEVPAPAAPCRAAPPAGGLLPRPLAHHLGNGIASLTWRTLAPGVEQFKIRLPRQDGDLLLLKLQPGRRHQCRCCHDGGLALVLSGAYADHTGEYHAGEVASIDREVERRPRVIGGGECIIAVAGEAAPG